MEDYHIGTAGWSYRDWEGVVYPLKKPRNFHAIFYLARYMNIVEINSTFYHPPSPRTAASWVRKAAPFQDFLFTAKLHSRFTHDRENIHSADVAAFTSGISPLMDSGRLASILAQFPWSFRRTAENRDYLDRLFSYFKDYPLTIEVRHGSWNRESFFSYLTDRKVAFCNIDQPLFRDSIEPSARATRTDFSYVRLHGRNTANWFREDAGRDQRYNYLYTAGELSDWIGRIRQLKKKSGKVYIITNNHYQGQALANAVQIKNMLSGDKVDIPLPLIEKYPVLKDILRKIKKGQMGLFEESTD